MCVCGPDPVIGAGRLGAVTAPPRSEHGRPRFGIGGGGAGLVLPNKISRISSFNISFIKYSQSFVHEPDPVTRAGQPGAIAAPYPTYPSFAPA